MDKGFSTIEKRYLWSLLAVLVFAFFYQLGIYPLFQEEPRRGLIALEMMHRENLWVPTQTGDLYLRKPPFYNWVLILAYKIFGENEFATRFFSVLSHLILGGITFLFSRKYLGQMAAVLISVSYLLSADILVYFSTLGEIDLFYALVTGSSLFLIFHFGERREFYSLFISVYILTAIGFLTKGLSSLPYTAISLLVYFIWNRDFKRLLSLSHISGIFVFALILFGYFYQYNRYEELSGWWTTLYSESADKATGGGFGEWISHFISFPIDTMKNLIPAAIALPLLFSKTVLLDLRKNRVVWYSLLVFVSNFLVYWLSTEGRSRYIYPIFPFACIVLIYICLNSVKLWKETYLKVWAYVSVGIMLLSFATIPFISSLKIIDGQWVISISGIILIATALVLLLRKKVRPYLILLGALTVLKFGFSAIVPQTRERATGAAEDKTLGIEIAEITQGEPLQRFGDVRMSYTIVFYLERDRGDVLYQTDSYTKGYYFCYTDDLPNSGYEVVEEFHYHEEPIFLIRLEE
ncbi:MAG: glycosyltransferase family 39 protein [Cytophagia bacterium]|nr:glycosyltransferase family 39 protein [Cytophagia bacterium]